MTRLAHLCMVAALAGGVLLTACSLLKPEHPAPDQTHAAVAPALLHVSQLDFGRDARFMRCLEPACPSVTPKTLAPPSAPIAPAPVGAASAAVAPRPAGLVAAALSPAPRIVAPRTLILHFGTNSAVLTAAHKALLGNALNDLRRTDRIVIAGRTDDLGSEALNEALALARALAIRDHLLDLAPDLPARITIDAKGRCCYAAPNDSNAGRARNRRVELAYTPRDEGPP